MEIESRAPIRKQRRRHTVIAYSILHFNAHLLEILANSSSESPLATSLIHSPTPFKSDSTRVRYSPKSSPRYHSTRRVFSATHDVWRTPSRARSTLLAVWPTLPALARPRTPPSTSRSPPTAPYHPSSPYTRSPRTRPAHPRQSKPRACHRRHPTPTRTRSALRPSAP